MGVTISKLRHLSYIGNKLEVVTVESYAAELCKTLNEYRSQNRLNAQSIREISFDPFDAENFRESLRHAFSLDEVIRKYTYRRNQSIAAMEAKRSDWPQFNATIAYLKDDLRTFLAEAERRKGGQPSQSSNQL